MAELNDYLKKLSDDRRVRIACCCVLALIVLSVLIAAATPGSVNVTNYINSGDNCKIARKIKIKDKKQKSKKSKKE